MVTRLTVLEIFTNPNDLEFMIAESEGKYGVMISRGRQHKFKLLLTAEPVFETREVAVDSIRAILDCAVKEGQHVFGDKSGTLTEVQVKRILQELSTKKTFSTSSF